MPAVSYRWQKNGAGIPGANEAIHEIRSAASNVAGTYSVIVSNSAGKVGSDAARLTLAAS
jgi:hypothetical protein